MGGDGPRCCRSFPSPLTLLAGPIATYNALALAAPVLCSTAAFVLCRYLTGARWPSIVGGAIFGFSPYVIGNEQVSALNLLMSRSYRSRSGWRCDDGIAI